MVDIFYNISPVHLKVLEQLLLSSICVCVCAATEHSCLCVSEWGGAEKKSYLASVDYMEKLTDDIFITFSTLPLFFPKQKPEESWIVKTQQFISRSLPTQNWTCICLNFPSAVFALRVKVQRFVIR